MNKVDIVSRGNATGVTWFFPPQNEHGSQNHFLARIATSLGGRAAEEILLQNDITPGAAGDIKTATELARLMVREWGMSEIGPIDFSVRPGFGGFVKDYSEETAIKVDIEVEKIVGQGMSQARTVLEDNLVLLQAIAEHLLEKEVITGEELDQIIFSMKPDFKSHPNCTRDQNIS